MAGAAFMTKTDLSCAETLFELFKLPIMFPTWTNALVSTRYQCLTITTMLQWSKSRGLCHQSSLVTRGAGICKHVKMDRASGKVLIHQETMSSPVFKALAFQISNEWNAEFRFT